MSKECTALKSMMKELKRRIRRSTNPAEEARLQQQLAQLQARWRRACGTGIDWDISIDPPSEQDITDVDEALKAVGKDTVRSMEANDMLAVLDVVFSNASSTG